MGRWAGEYFYVAFNQWFSTLFFPLRITGQWCSFPSRTRAPSSHRHHRHHDVGLRGRMLKFRNTLNTSFPFGESLFYKYTLSGPVVENWSESQRVVHNSVTFYQAPVLGKASGPYKDRWEEALGPKERDAYSPHKCEVGGAKDRTRATGNILLGFRGGLTPSD